MVFRRIGRLMLGLAVLWAGVAHAEDGSADAGKAVFKKCAVCHSPDQGVNKVGPSLFGIVGRHAAGIGTYNYSAAMKALDKTWDEAGLDAFLADPRGAVPGTKMAFPGLKDATDRQNVIAIISLIFHNIYYPTYISRVTHTPVPFRDARSAASSASGRDYRSVIASPKGVAIQRSSRWIAASASPPRDDGSRNRLAD